MKSVLILRRIKIENANAISGIVYGFPAVTHFLGFVHALSRELEASQGIHLGGVGIVCHHIQTHTHEFGWGEQAFALTRNPLTKEGKTPSFNEEGRVHLEISLVIECPFSASQLDYETDSNKEDVKRFEDEVKRIASSKHIAGGYVTSIEGCMFKRVPDTEDEQRKFVRQTIRGLLPGFILRDRSDLLQEHLKQNPEKTSFDALLDFYVLKSKAVKNDEDPEEKSTWKRLSKPAIGWFVPIQVGYKAISPLYEPGQVCNARDKTVPFRFVESAYSLGEWISPHRIKELKDILWKYQFKNNFYVCSNERSIELCH